MPVGQWITPREASVIISEQSGHRVSPDYVKKLGNVGRIRTKQLNTRIKLYHVGDVKAIRVRQNRKKEATTS